MDPVAFEIFGIEVMWYGVLISIGVFIGIILALRETKRVGVKEDDFIDLLIFAIPGAIIGARLYYVIFNWDYYGKNLDQILNFRGGGLAIHGAIIAAIIVAILFTRKRKLDFWQMADIAAPS